MNGGQEPWIAGDQERRTLWSRGVLAEHLFPPLSTACVCTVWTRDTIMMIVTRSHWLRAQDPEEKSPQHHSHVPWSSPCCLVCSELHARYTDAMWTVVWYELGWTSRCVRTESRLLQSADKSLITRMSVKKSTFFF